MRLFTVIKHEVEDDEIVWKFPQENLRLGSQLIVRTGQVAFFCRDGKIYDQFTEGTYTIKSNNIPLLDKLINIPFGNQSPFQAEVWFINTLIKLDSKWGTAKPVLLEDPKYGIVVPVRAFGQYGIQVKNPCVLFESLIGTIKYFTNRELTSYFAGLIVTRASDIIAEQVAIKGVSILKISSLLQDLSDELLEHLKPQFERFGFNLVNFFIMSINVPEDDTSVIALKKATEKRMHVGTVGKDVYSFDRSMDVMEKAASNKGTGGDLMGAAMGLGMGFALGPKLGNHMEQMGNQMKSGLNSDSPPPTTEIQYYVFHKNQQYGPFNLNSMKSHIQQGLINAETYVWKPGMANWDKAKALQELAPLFSTTSVTPPPPPTES